MEENTTTLDPAAGQKADEEIDAGGSIEVLDPTGHFEIHWGKKKAEVDHAEAMFYDLLKKGYIAFKKTKILGRKGRQASEFDPKDRAYIFEKSGPPPKALPVIDAEKAETEKAEAEKAKLRAEIAAEKAASAESKKDEPVKVDAKREESKDEDDGEHEHEQTKEFDKKAKHTMVPPYRGG